MRRRPTQPNPLESRAVPTRSLPKETRGSTSRATAQPTPHQINSRTQPTTIGYRLQYKARSRRRSHVSGSKSYSHTGSTDNSSIRSACSRPHTALAVIAQNGCRKLFDDATIEVFCPTHQANFGFSYLIQYLTHGSSRCNALVPDHAEQPARDARSVSQRSLPVIEAAELDGPTKRICVDGDTSRRGDEEDSDPMRHRAQLRRRFPGSPLVNRIWHFARLGRAPHPSRRPLGGLLRMRLRSSVLVESAAAPSILILRARQRRAPRRMATREIASICDFPGFAPT